MDGRCRSVKLLVSMRPTRDVGVVDAASTLKPMAVDKTASAYSGNSSQWNVTLATSARR